MRRFLSLFARLCSRCAEYTCLRLLFFLADIYIYIHAQSEASSSSSSNLYSALCVALWRRKTENVCDAERTQRRRQRTKRNERK
mmetsp:Transcript_7901/g.26101  ORF Transcript_7901/g.26101 Transcript_7901/m.26101 type:complete len:84 (+) Transcript_7901:23-274(+)